MFDWLCHIFIIKIVATFIKLIVGCIINILQWLSPTASFKISPPSLMRLNLLMATHTITTTSLDSLIMHVALATVVLGGRLANAIIFDALNVEVDDLFVDVGCGCGVVVNPLCLKFQQIDAIGIENSIGQFEVACTITANIMHDIIYNKLAEFIFGSFYSPFITAPILDHNHTCIWFNNFGRCMKGMPQSWLEILLEEHCRQGACVASCSPMFLSTLWHCKKY